MKINHNELLECTLTIHIGLLEHELSLMHYSNFVSFWFIFCKAPETVNYEANRHLLFCGNFMAKTNCLKTPLLCFQDLGTQAPCCSLAGAGAGARVCLWGARAHFGASERSCSSSENRLLLLLADGQVVPSWHLFPLRCGWLPAEAHPRRCSWRPALLPCWVSAGSTWSMGKEWEAGHGAGTWWCGFT